MATDLVHHSEVGRKFLVIENQLKKAGKPVTYENVKPLADSMGIDPKTTDGLVYDDENFSAVPEQVESAKPVEAANQDEQVIDELAKLGKLEYGQKRKEAAKQLGITVTILDKIIEDKQKPAPANNTEITTDCEPWHKPVKGSELAEIIYKDITTHIVLPVHSAVAITLWVLLTYTFDSFRILPILAILSPEKRCGKTTLLTLLNALVNNGIMASNISSAAVYRVVEKFTPTLLTDEADTFFKTNEELRGIYNSGHNKEAAFVVRCNSETNDPEMFSTWCPKAISMIGKLPDTIADRSIIVDMCRKTQGETVKKKSLTHYEDNIVSRQKALRWSNDTQDILRIKKVDMPECDNDRMSDNWEPIFAIAQHIGNGWQEKATEAIKKFTGANEDIDSIGSMLLSDIQEIFIGIDSDRISSEDLVNKLIAIDDRPWPEWKRGNPMTKAGLARLLKRFSIKSKKIKFSGSPLQGYYLKHFKETFSRYIPPSQSGTVELINNNKDLDNFQNGTRENEVPLQKRDNLSKSLSSSTVPPCNPPSEEYLKSEVEV